MDNSDFQPQEASIDRVVVWVRFSGLPIEYYDKKFLSAIGNRIGRTVRVDKNTSKQERGKYARMSVEVDLTQPLLAMFEVHDHMYPVEYEGLHFLCLTCGRFGHYNTRRGRCSHKSSPAAEVPGGTAEAGDG